MSNGDLCLRVLLFADTHLGFDDPVRPRVARRRRGPDFFVNFQRVLDHARDIRPDLVVHGGDLFFRRRVPRPVVDRAYAALLDLAAAGIPVFIVPGNHERGLLPVDLVLTHPKLHVFDRPRTFVLDLPAGRVALAGFPFARKVGNGWAELLAATRWDEAQADLRLLCLHQAVEGATVGPADFRFRAGVDVIARRDFPPGLEAVLAGHIHRRQILRQPRGEGRPPLPVFYPGSTERTAFAEKDESKGFYELSFMRESAGWRIAAAFETLPARPMVDLQIPAGLDPMELAGFLQREAARLDPDAIVRLRTPSGLPASLRSQITSAWLRDRLPPTMNALLGREFPPREVG